MSRLLDEREHAAEGLFAHDEELRFLARRRAIEALSAWATEAMSVEGEAAAGYETRLVDAFVSGTPEDRILAQVQTDLERAGKPALSTTAATVHAQALAQATDELHGRVAPQPRPAQPAHHYHPIDASLSWRD